MDFIDLAKLPLSTLILVAFLYVVFLYYKWALAAHETRQKEAAFIHRFRCHVAFNFGVFLEVYRDNETRIEAAAKALKEGKKEPEDPKGLLDILSDLLIGPSPAPLPGGLKAVSPVSTKGFMDYDEVSSQFHLLDEMEAGLALYFIEQHALVYQTIAMLTAEIEAKAPLKDRINTLKLLRKALADAVVVSHALLSPDVRRQLKPGPEHTPPQSHIPDQSPQQVFADILLRYPSETEEETPDMYVSAYRVLDVKQSRPGWWPFLVVPAIFVAVIAFVLQNDDLHGFFFPGSGSSIACEVTTWPGGAETRSCAYGADTLDQGLGRPQSLTQPPE